VIPVAGRAEVSAGKAKEEKKRGGKSLKYEGKEKGGQNAVGEDTNCIQYLRRESGRKKGKKKMGKGRKGDVLYTSPTTTP